MGMTRGGRWAGVAALVLPLWAGAQEWETVATSPIVVRVRELKGAGGAREVWAEGVINAPIRDVEAAILDTEAYPRFMPHVKESRTLGAAPGGGKLTYTLLEPPFLSPRDYVLRVTVLRKTGEDGSGEFANSWHAVPDAAPRRRGVVRLRLLDGGWRIRPTADGRSRAVYRARVDPGAWMPGFVSDMANKSGTIDTFKAVEKDARRRARQRQAHASPGPPPGPD